MIDKIMEYNWNIFIIMITMKAFNDIFNFGLSFIDCLLIVLGSLSSIRAIIWFVLNFITDAEKNICKS